MSNTPLITFHGYKVNDIIDDTDILRDTGNKSISFPDNFVKN
ncbi:hypothetical protein SPPR111872_13025 [Sphingobacterium prati]